MASYGMNDVKNGMKIMVDNYPCTIVDTEYIKPGKGQAFTRVKYRNIKTGRVVDGNWQVLDGLKAGDKLIVQGLQNLRPDMKVTPMPAQTAPAPGAK